jgi:hypothetical protein
MILLVLASCSASGNSGAPLPLRSLTLYELGVGYYERDGNLKSGSVAEIPLEPGQLDDALKTLVVVSPGGVASIEYDPPFAPNAARARAGLPAAEKDHRLADLLLALKGVEVRAETHDGTKAQGRVMNVELAEGEGATKPDKEALVLFGAAGLQRLSLNELWSVSPVDSNIRLAWDRAAAAEATPIGHSVLRVHGGSGAGRVAVGYATEAPVWRTTYRFVLGEHKPRLQGFAVVHNDSDESWRQVRVTLVSGKPTSFVFPIAGPRYGRRDVVRPSDDLQAAPQLSTTEAREVLNGTEGASGYGDIELGGMGTVGYGAGGGGMGSAHGVGGLGIQSESASSLLVNGPTPIAPAAVSEAGDLFLYTVREPVDLAARRSALLPILDTDVTAERVSVIGTEGAVRDAIRFTNSTPLTLEAGVLSVFTDGAYAGEAQLDRVKPKEVRVVRYGEDLDVEVSHTEESSTGPAQIVRVVGNRVEIHRVDRLVHQLDATSRSDRGRILLVELPNSHYRVVEGAEEDVRSPDQPRYARVRLDPRRQQTFRFTEEGAVAERIPASQLTTSYIDSLMKSDRLDEASRSGLVAARVQAVQFAAASSKQAEAKKRLAEAQQDLERLRANVESAGKGGARAAADALASKLVDAEARVDRWRAVGESAEASTEFASDRILDSLSAKRP